MTVDYGYDLQTISITDAIFAKIQAGQPVVVEGQGFQVEGAWERDQWAFNHGTVGAVRVMTDTGREVFEGGFGGAEVVVHGE